MVATCLSVLVLGLSARAEAEFDWPVSVSLPDNDWAVGVSGGVAFGEELRARTTGWLAGLDVSWLDGVFGIHGGLRVHREGFDHRLVGYLEATVWYVVLIGAGSHFGGMLGDGGPRVTARVVALHGYFGVPIPVARLGGGAMGALVVLPYVRPGMRWGDGGDVYGYHEAGVALRWTSFGF